MEYLVNEEGERTRVVLTVEEYERLLDAAEELEDIVAHDKAVAEIESGEDEVIPWEESKRRRASGRSGDSSGGL